MSATEPVRGRSFSLFIAGLAFTQIMGWGTTFYLPSILERQIGQDIGAGREVVFGGITVMLVVSALVGPRMGRFVDEKGARAAMAIGKLLLGLGLVGIGLSNGPVGYLAAWAVIGLGAPLGLSIGALAATTQSFPDRGRRGLQTLLLFGGLSNGVLWPITGWLEAEIGWRAVCFVYAGVQILLCLPLAHALIRRAPGSRTAEAEAIRAAKGRLPERLRSSGFWLLVVAGGFSGLISWGLPLYFVAMFQQGGLSAAAAIFLGSLTAYFTFVARLAEYLIGNRIAGVRVAAAAALFPPLVFALLLVALGAMPPGAAQTAAIALAMAIYGASTGLIAVSRATLPLELFGAGGYATMLGKLSFFLNLMFAASPLLFAFVYDGLGKAAALWIGLIGSLVAALGYWRLDRLVAEADSR